MAEEAKKAYDEFGFLRKLMCPKCGSEDLKLSHVDDVRTEWLQCQKCGNYCTKPKAKAKEELAEKLENTFSLTSCSVAPIFDLKWKMIHPAVDAVDGVAYVGVGLPCQVTDNKGKVKLQDYHFLIGSDRSQILCRKEELAKRKIQLSHTVVKLPNRWSLESVKNWLDGKTSADPEALYIAIKTAFEMYIEFEDPAIYDFLTLWTIGTYFFHLFNSYPYLYIGGMKQVGKTKLLTLLSLLCHNGIFSNNISTSSAFRLIQSGRCTLLMDETEVLSNPERQVDFRNMLFAGYKKGALVYRTHKDTLKPEPFEVYAPKAIANIIGIEDVLEDRCITIIMKRGKNLEIVNKEVPLESEVWQQMRDQLYVFYLSYFNELGELSEQVNFVVEALSERELELWKPILALALFFDKYIPNLSKHILEFAKQKAEEKKIENLTETLEYILVQTLLECVKGDGFYKVKDIKEAVASCFDEEVRWLTTKWVGNCLRKLGFAEKRRVGTGYEYFLSRGKIEDLAERLGIEVKASTSTLTSKFTCSVSSLNTSIPEVYNALREQLTEPFYDHKALDLIMKLKQCGLEDAKKVWQIFVNEGRVFQNSFGFWEWVK